MFENIPKRWNIFSLNDLATIITGNTPPKNHSAYYETEDILWVKPSDLSEWNPWLWETEEKLSENARKVIRILPVNSVLVSCIGTIGKIGIAPVELATNQQINSVIFNDKIINFKYGYYAFKYYKERLANLASNAVVPIINKTQFSTFKIPVPPTLEEQQEIVDVLDAASEIIRLRTACIESAQSLIPALFQEMFGDPINNNKNYPCESLKNLCSKIGSGATPRGGKESYLKEGISFVRSMNVHDGIFQYKDLAFINDEQAKLLDNVELQESDVLINITGASVARTCIVPKEILPARVNQHVSILRCTGRLNPYFLNVLLYFQTTKQKLLDLANSKGATREAITKQQLELFKIILPPIEQQELFATKVQEIEEYIKSQQAELENAKIMFQSLLHHTFTGELTRHKFGGDANG